MIEARAHQATAVAIDERAILIEGPPGAGKSSLALAMIDRGAMLVGDDSIILEPRGHRLWAAPHPNTRGLLEIRNVGLVTYPTTGAAVSLVIQLSPDAPRHIDACDSIERAGMMLPMIALWPETPVLALRAEAALVRWGL